MRCSVVVPYFNNESTVNESLLSLLNQDVKPNEIVLVDDGSRIPASQVTLDSILREIRIIRHTVNRGLAASYNTGISHTSEEILMFMHPDVVLSTSNELATLLRGFCNEEIVATCHGNALFSESYWNSLNLYQKSLMGAAMNPRSRGFDGKFDAVRRTAIQKIGSFDDYHFRTAGEDGDLVWRLRKVGDVVQTDAKAEHRHAFGDQHGMASALRKSFQYGTAMGVLVRLHRFKFAILNSQGLWREITFVIVIAETAFKQSFPISVLLVIWLTLDTPRTIFKRDKRLGRVLPLFGIGILRNFAHTFGLVVGFLRGRQI